MEAAWSLKSPPEGEDDPRKRGKTKTVPESGNEDVKRSPFQQEKRPPLNRVT